MLESLTSVPRDSRAPGFQAAGDMTEDIPSPGPVTRLLLDWSDGDERARDEMLPLVYDELRRLAALYLLRERRDHTLQPTALVHEAYLRLVDQRQVNWKNRAQFVGLAAVMMRRILVNHARDRPRASAAATCREFRSATPMNRADLRTWTSSSSMTPSIDSPPSMRARAASSSSSSLAA